MSYDGTVTIPFSGQLQYLGLAAGCARVQYGPLPVGMVDLCALALIFGNESDDSMLRPLRGFCSSLWP
jgi:hypothetical protein